MRDLDRRAAMATLAGGVAAAPILAATRQRAAPRFDERALPAQTTWVPPPALSAAHEGLAKLDDTSLYFQDTGGSGDAVVLLHAYTGSYAMWGYQQGAFAAAGHRVITYSARNHYRSAAIDPKAPGNVTADLRGLLDALGVQRAHLVGTAGGALGVLDFALSHPDRTISATLSSSHMGISDPDYLAAGSKMFPKGVYNISHSFSEVGPSYRAGNPAGVEAWDALERVAWQGGSVRQDTERPITLGRIERDLRVPALLLTGDADLMMPPSRMRQVRTYMKGAELVTVAEAGHSLHWEQPEAFNSAVLPFLRRHGEARRSTRA